MTYIDYRWATAQLSGWSTTELDSRIRALSEHDPPFYGVVMLAMRRADTTNLSHLRAAWPTVYAELMARYHAPGGVLPDDPEGLRTQILGERA